jgi:two-component system OmpR family response regulator
VRKLQRIVHVEDDESIRAIAKIALERIGSFTLLSCASGSEALEKTKQFAPDMILLDVMMPGLDGPTTLKKLRELMDLTEVAIVFMTAKVQSTEIEYYKSIGACNVVLKPFDVMTLSEQLGQYWTEFNGE